MPVISQGTQKCRLCGKEFNWVEMEYRTRKHIDELSSGDFEAAPAGKSIACRSGINGEYLEAHCSHCDALNKIVRD